MRMWMVNPKMLCRKHLLGEHVELHMFMGWIKKDKDLTGFVEKGLVQVDQIPNRHNELILEMTNRGYNHASEFTTYDYADWRHYIANKMPYGFVSKEKSIAELLKRCPECKKRYEELK